MAAKPPKNSRRSMVSAFRRSKNHDATFLNPMSSIVGCPGTESIRTFPYNPALTWECGVGIIRAIQAKT